MVRPSYTVPGFDCPRHKRSCPTSRRPCWTGSIRVSREGRKLHKKVSRDFLSCTSSVCIPQMPTGNPDPVKVRAVANTPFTPPLALPWVPAALTLLQPASLPLAPFRVGSSLHIPYGALSSILFLPRGKGSTQLPWSQPRHDFSS